MREAINENPVVQAVLIGVLLLVAAFLLLAQMGGGSKGNGQSSPAAAGVATVPATPVAPTSAGTVPTAPASTPVVTTATAEFVAGPGLPAGLVADHAQGKTVVLYIEKPGGIEDKKVRSAVNGLRGDPGVSVFITDPKGIARYAEITQGVGVSQVPALVVVSPVKSGGAPRATVSYGFREAESVQQAVRDAVYRGGTRGYDPG